MKLTTKTSETAIFGKMRWGGSTPPAAPVDPVTARRPWIADLDIETINKIAGLGESRTLKETVLDKFLAYVERLKAMDNSYELAARRASASVSELFEQLAAYSDGSITPRQAYAQLKSVMTADTKPLFETVDSRLADAADHMNDILSLNDAIMGAIPSISKLINNANLRPKEATAKFAEVQKRISTLNPLQFRLEKGYPSPLDSAVLPRKPSGVVKIGAPPVPVRAADNALPSVNVPGLEFDPGKITPVLPAEPPAERTAITVDSDPVPATKQLPAPVHTPPPSDASTPDKDAPGTNVAVPPKSVTPINTVIPGSAVTVRDYFEDMHHDPDLGQNARIGAIVNNSANVPSEVYFNDVAVIRESQDLTTLLIRTVQQLARKNRSDLAKERLLRLGIEQPVSFDNFDFILGLLPRLQWVARTGGRNMSPLEQDSKLTISRDIHFSGLPGKPLEKIEIIFNEDDPRTPFEQAIDFLSIDSSPSGEQVRANLVAALHLNRATRVDPNADHLPGVLDKLKFHAMIQRFMSSKLNFLGKIATVVGGKVRAKALPPTQVYNQLFGRSWMVAKVDPVSGKITHERATYNVFSREGGAHMVDTFITENGLEGQVDAAARARLALVAPYAYAKLASYVLDPDSPRNLDVALPKNVLAVWAMLSKNRQFQAVLKAGASSYANEVNLSIKTAVRTSKNMKQPTRALKQDTLPSAGENQGLTGFLASFRKKP